MGVRSVGIDPARYPTGCVSLHEPASPARRLATTVVAEGPRDSRVPRSVTRLAAQ